MKAIPIHEAKANLSKYIQQAKAGKTIYIGARGDVEVVLTAAPKQQPISLFGAMKGQFKFSQKEWDEASRLVNEDFDNSEIFPNAD